MYNHNKAQQSKNRVHISWDILYSWHEFDMNLKLQTRLPHPPRGRGGTNLTYELLHSVIISWEYLICLNTMSLEKQANAWRCTTYILCGSASTEMKYMQIVVHGSDKKKYDGLGRY